MGARKSIDEAAVLEMLAGGATPTEVAATLAVSEGHAHRLLLRSGLDTPAMRQRRAEQRAASVERNRQTMKILHDLKVPTWVKSAGLESDYRDHARIFGEYEAARHCRRLTAEMRRAVA